MAWTRRQWALGVATAALGCGPGSKEASDAEDALDVAAAPQSHIIDLHCDTPMLLRQGGYDLGIRNDRGEVDIPRMRDGGVTAVFFSIYCSPHSNTETEAVGEALRIIDAVHLEVARFPEDLLLTTTTSGIEEARRTGRIAILVGVEGGHMIDSSTAILRSLWRLGARYLTLTHSKDTAWAGSSGSEGNRGLSGQGREIVSEMNRLGMMVDISHVSDQTFWDVLETSSAPLIASHSSARSLCAHKRNMTDEMIRATADRGGVVHINYYSRFVDSGYAARAARWDADHPRTPEHRKPGERTRQRTAAIGRPPLDTLLDHFEHVAQVGGIEAVGLGSDFDGVDGELPEGVEDIAGMPTLIQGLERRGFGGADLEKILGLNSLRVFSDVESAASAQTRRAGLESVPISST